MIILGYWMVSDNFTKLPTSRFFYLIIEGRPQNHINPVQQESTADLTPAPLLRPPLFFTLLNACVFYYLTRTA